MADTAVLAGTAVPADTAVLAGTAGTATAVRSTAAAGLQGDRMASADLRTTFRRFFSFVFY